MKELKEVVPKETIIIWNLAMPLGQNIRGGFLVPEVRRSSKTEAMALFKEISQQNQPATTVLDVQFAACPSFPLHASYF